MFLHNRLILSVSIPVSLKFEYKFRFDQSYSLRSFDHSPAPPVLQGLDFSSHRMSPQIFHSANFAASSNETGAVSSVFTSGI